MRVRPIHLIPAIVVVGTMILGAEWLSSGGLSSASYERVRPSPQGIVTIDLAGLKASQVRFFSFLNPGNQEVRFFVGRDPSGVVQVAFDANELCAKLKRGYRHQGEWVVCNKCDKAFRLAEVNAGGGGCKPIPLAHRLNGDQLVLNEGEILKGWRYFN